MLLRNLLITCCPLALPKRNMFRQKHITISNPLARRIKPPVACHCNTPHLGIRRQLVKRGLVLVMDSLSERSEQVFEPGGVGDNRDLGFGTGGEPLHHGDAAGGAIGVGFAGVFPHLIVFGGITKTIKVDSIPSIRIHRGHIRHNLRLRTLLIARKQTITLLTQRMHHERDVTSAKNNMRRLQSPRERTDDDQLGLDTLQLRSPNLHALIDTFVGEASVHVPPGAWGGKRARRVVSVGGVGFVVRAFRVTDEVDSFRTVGEEEGEAVFGYVGEGGVVLADVGEGGFFSIIVGHGDEGVLCFVAS
mmetsp:Transcript_6834/g.12825  ORF Transcript_6834/g.12825 Transcript_6834/m.12825 type:complete len:304 (-) Transcript_6834:44-955(-)